MDNSLLVKRLVERRLRKKRLFEHRPFESVSIGDIAFLLLIFFIVTSSFILREGIFFSLPSRNAATVRLLDDQVAEVEPTAAGFRYRGTEMGRSVFVGEMKRFIAKDPKRVLIIAMGQRVRYERMVDALSVARETGIRRVAIKNLEGGRL